MGIYSKIMWEKIGNQSDIDKLLSLYGGFHDSCIREIYFSTSEFVDEKLAMHFENRLTAAFLFQRQFRPNSVIELKFEDVIQFNFKPLGNSEKAVLYDASLKLKDEIFYWADFIDWENTDNDSIWISSKKLFWRLRPDLIGNIKRIDVE